MLRWLQREITKDLFKLGFIFLVCVPTIILENI
jgi:hypothetical protein